MTQPRANAEKHPPDAPATAGVTDEFVRRLTECQNRLYVYILALLPDPDRARDVLQETNVVLWRKADQFEPGTSFQAWACKVAYYEVLTERRRRGRDKLLFDDSTMELVADAATKRLESHDERAVALDECLKRLDQQQRSRLHDRYGPGGSVQLAAQRAGRTPGSIAVTLHRIRAALLRCIEGKLAKELAT
ncbi:sigma-70 family RNA polymerase sigma factor [Botrimarina sp.]|uniref:sigma-70 family RNA polymerase sigma factor n=1 Tax=Botrimarina sp. TaxID=2795802 RepID=UPI0032EF97AF